MPTRQEKIDRLAKIERLIELESQIKAKRDVPWSETIGAATGAMGESVGNVLERIAFAKFHGSPSIMPQRTEKQERAEALRSRQTFGQNLAAGAIGLSPYLVPVAGQALFAGELASKPKDIPALLEQFAEHGRTTRKAMYKDGLWEAMGKKILPLPYMDGDPEAIETLRQQPIEHLTSAAIALGAVKGGGMLVRKGKVQLGRAKPLEQLSTGVEPGPVIAEPLPKKAVAPKPESVVPNWPRQITKTELVKRMEPYWPAPFTEKGLLKSKSFQRVTMDISGLKGVDLLTGEYPKGTIPGITGINRPSGVTSQARTPSRTPGPPIIDAKVFDATSPGQPQMKFVDIDIIDGWHRMSEAIKRGDKSIEVYVGREALPEFRKFYKAVVPKPELIEVKPSQPLIGVDKKVAIAVDKAVQQTTEVPTPVARLAAYQATYTKPGDPIKGKTPTTKIDIPKEFSEYKDFKDAHAGMGGGTKDWDTFVQEIGGARTPRELSKLSSQVDPASKYITWRTEDINLMSMEWHGGKQQAIAEMGKNITRKEGEVALDVLKNISTKDVKLTTKELMARPGIGTADPKIVEFAVNARRYLDEVRSEVNYMRKQRGQSDIGYHEYYTPDILRGEGLFGETIHWGKKPGDLKPHQELPTFANPPDKPYNPHEMAKKFGMEEFMVEKDIFNILDRYTNAMGKDIYATSIIQNNYAFAEFLKKKGYPSAARGVRDYTAEGYAGVNPVIDRAIYDKMSPKHKRLFRKATAGFRLGLTRTVFPFNWLWAAKTQPTSLSLTVANYGFGRTLRGMWDFALSPELRKEVGKSYHYQVKRAGSGRATRQAVGMGRTTQVATRKGFPQKAVDAYEFIGNIMIDLNERALTGTSIAAARRFYHKEGFRGDALKKYASQGGGKTQSMYNLEARPGIIKGTAVKTSNPFQTFSFQMVNAIRENVLGKTGIPPNTAWKRAAWAARFATMYMTFNVMHHKMWGQETWSPYVFMPIVGPYVKMGMDAAFGKGTYQSTRGLPAPVGVGLEFGKALGSYLKTGNVKKMRKWGVRYGTAGFGISGGTQASRLVEGWIAIADEGVYDVRGRPMYDIVDPADQMMALFAGPGGTKTAREYWDRRTRGDESDLGKALKVMGGVR